MSTDQVGPVALSCGALPPRGRSPRGSIARAGDTACGAWGRGRARSARNSPKSAPPLRPRHVAVALLRLYGVVAPRGGDRVYCSYTILQRVVRAAEWYPLPHSPCNNLVLSLATFTVAPAADFSLRRRARV